MTLTEPAMPVTTIEAANISEQIGMFVRLVWTQVPAHADKRFYEGVLELLAAGSSAASCKDMASAIYCRSSRVHLPQYQVCMTNALAKSATLFPTRLNPTVAG